MERRRDGGLRFCRRTAPGSKQWCSESFALRMPNRFGGRAAGGERQHAGRHESYEFHDRFRSLKGQPVAHQVAQQGQGDGAFAFQRGAIERVERADQRRHVAAAIAHEIGHLKQPSLVDDWAMEGFCMLFSKYLCGQLGHDWSIWERRLHADSDDPYARAYRRALRQR